MHFLSRDYRVFFLPLRYLGRRDARYKKSLEKMGVRFLPGSGDPCARLRKLAAGRRCPTVIFERIHSMLPLGPVLPLLPRIIVDTQEVRYRRLARRSSIFGGEIDREKAVELDVYRMADVLIAVSEEDRAVLQRHFPKKPVVTVDLCTDISGPYRGGFPERSDIAFFASFFNAGQRLSHNQNIDAVDFFTRDILPRVKAKLPGARFHVFGAGSSSLRFPGIVYGGKVRDIRSELSRFRVFVCPLRYGAGVKKKLLDAAMSGTPAVTTSVGAEGTGFRNGKDIFIADGPAAFASRVALLYADREVWDRMSRNAFTATRRFHSMRVMQRQLACVPWVQ